LLATSACDQLHQADEVPATGGPVSVLDTNMKGSLPPGARLEVAFDRLLLPACVTRQTFVLTDKRNNPPMPLPEVAYDPVARVVTVIPQAPLQDQQFYQLRIATPQSGTDPNGLRAIDGATLAPGPPTVFTFQVDATLPAPVALPAVDYCRDIVPVLFQKCNGVQCHIGTSNIADGLSLSPNASMISTAVGRVSVGANTGPRAAAVPPGLHFGLDMPILDPGTGGATAGDPGNSWLLYKLLMAVPSSQSARLKECDGGVATPVDLGSAHAVTWQPLSDHERGILTGMVLGSAMPFPGAANPLTMAELERVSRWIGQPRGQGVPLVPASCGCIQ
jgi:hypothetical protein